MIGTTVAASTTQIGRWWCTLLARGAEAGGILGVNTPHFSYPTPPTFLTVVIYEVVQTLCLITLHITDLKFQ